MEDVDLYVLFANAFDNAIEASSKLPNEKRGSCVLKNSTQLLLFGCNIMMMPRYHIVLLYNKRNKILKLTGRVTIS